MRKLRKSNYGLENSVEAYACVCTCAQISACLCAAESLRVAQYNLTNAQLVVNTRNARQSN